jgi:hypothetical protein
MEIFARHGWRSYARLEDAWFWLYVLRMFLFLWRVFGYFSIYKALCRRLQKIGTFCVHIKKIENS